MTNTEAMGGLPDDIKAFFWDYDAERLSWDRSRHTIAFRLLEKGGMRAVRWLRQHMSDDEIRDFIVRRRGRGISPRRLRFWGLLLDIPRRDVDEWIEAARRNPWNRRTHG
ncbi:MAG: hypothetical protein EA351_04130 [Gemmatimonadales bacterium]|nr:MAG: hypothetical protein EA351_04130 [Gemmatimonadales bacterium]